MKVIGLFFTLVLIGVVVLAIKFTTSHMTKNSEEIGLVESNTEYKNELSKFNQQDEGEAVSQTDGASKIIASTASIDETTLPSDVRSYIQKGEIERAFIEFSGLYGIKSELERFKSAIPTAQWEHDYIIKKFSEIVDIPSVRSDPVLVNMLLTSMVAIEEIKKETRAQLLESLKDLNQFYQQKREEHADQGSLDRIHFQIIAGYSATLRSSNKQTDPNIVLDETLEIVKAVKNKEINRKIASIFLEENPDQEQSFHEAMQAEEIDISSSSYPDSQYSQSIQPVYEESTPEN